MGNIVTIKNVTKTFHLKDSSVTALQDINLDIEEGSFVSIIGGSGCGKSTLLRIIGGLDTEYEGQILVDGKPVTRPSREKGFVFQDHRLLPWKNVKENIRFSLPKEQKKNDELISHYIELVGLKDFETALPKELSGGMSQRVSIARALANKPRILLLDEPFGALDAITRIQLQEELLRIWEKEKITMILVTHDIDEAIYLGQKVVVMNSRPGHIKNDVRIDLGIPRRRTGPAFTDYKTKIYEEFFADTSVPFSYSI